MPIQLEQYLLFLLQYLIPLELVVSLQTVFLRMRMTLLAKINQTHFHQNITIYLFAICPSILILKFDNQKQFGPGISCRDQTYCDNETLNQSCSSHSNFIYSKSQVAEYS